MISYENARELIEILTKDVDYDTSSWINFFTDESEANNITPEPPEVKRVSVKYFEKNKEDDGTRAPVAIVDIEILFGVYFSLNVNDFTRWGIGNILKNIQCANNCIKLKL